MQESNPYNKLFEGRIICLGTLESTLAAHTGRDEQTVRVDIDRDLFLTAQQAIDYGLAHQIVPSRKLGRNLS